ncbi:MAG: glutamate racemase [Ruminococcaceae bacterium]|nr:glutamate racemase [Oscillospiraceae bacterium]
MDQRSIGVFDSGLGGLTAVRELKRVLPTENIIYFGDTGRVPYGTRSDAAIVKYTRQDINFLKRFDVKMILVACGTVSSVGLPVLREEYPGLPLIGVVESASRAAAKATKNGKVAILGTNGTIRSGSYQAELKRICPDVDAIGKACPMFVPLVENGYTDGQVARLIVEEYLEEVLKFGADTIVLGCTHYPLLKKVISEVAGSDVTLIDVGAQAAHLVKEELTERGMLAEEDGSVSYYVSDNVENFATLGSLFLQCEIKEQVEKIDIERF